MECLRQYCADICNIDSLQTFIISPSKYEDMLKDDELLKCLKISEKHITSFIKTAREVGTEKIYLAFVYQPSWIEKFQWMPVHCYKNGNKFYHVHYRDSWICKECGNTISGSFIMPMVETDPIIYHRSENKYPNIPLIFQKVKCPKCGEPLQNHLIIIK